MAIVDNLQSTRSRRARRHPSQGVTIIFLPPDFPDDPLELTSPRSRRFGANPPSDPATRCSEGSPPFSTPSRTGMLQRTLTSWDEPQLVPKRFKSAIFTEPGVGSSVTYQMRTTHHCAPAKRHPPATSIPRQALRGQSRVSTLESKGRRFHGLPWSAGT